MNADRAGSRHDRYRERLVTLMHDEAPIEAIVEAGRRSGAWGADRRWVRSYGRFFPDREPFVTLVYETVDEPQLVCHVDVFERQPVSDDGTDGVVGQEVGWLRVTPFPRDESLPTLAAALDHPGRRTIIRYRPHSRCTIRFETPDGHTYYVKVFRDEAGQASHVNSQLLWRAAESNELDFTVARPVRWDAGTRTLWHEALPGRALDARDLEAAGPGLAVRMGRATASLTRSRLRPRAVYDWDAHFARSAGNAEDIGWRIPQLSKRLDALLAELRQAHAGLTARANRPIHGSLSRTQWVDGTPRLGLVDFDKMALGDPEFDVAAFLTELDYDRVHVERIRTAFIAGFEAVAGPLDRRLLDLYAAQERLEKALKSARSVRPDGDLRAEKHLESALAECVEHSA
jgi:hypothetical protein